jgi:DNA-binding IclR family transcriptional regulator
VAKIIHVMEAMAPARSGMQVGELARKVQLPKASIFEVLYTVKDLGYGAHGDR